MGTYGGRGGRGGGYRRDREWNDEGGEEEYRGKGYKSGGGYWNNYDGRGGGYRGGRRGGQGGEGGYPSGDRYDGGSGRYGGGRYDSGRWSRGRGRNYHWGRQDDGRARSNREEALPPDIAFLTELKGHTKTVTCMAFDQQRQELYTGSKDQTVRRWSCVSGECVGTLEVSGDVDSILVAGEYLFVGYHREEEGIIKVWNMTDGKDHLLTGHKREVYALATGCSGLVSAGHDGTVRVWGLNEQAKLFTPVAILSKEEGGHQYPVHALATSGRFAFSADRYGNMRVWQCGASLSQWQCSQAIERAHDACITSLLMWEVSSQEVYLLSASFDGAIKVWQGCNPPSEGSVLQPRPVKTFIDGEGDRRPHSQQELPGVLTIHGTPDSSNKPVLMASYNDQRMVGLFDLPTFSSRGHIKNVIDCRAITTVPSTGVMILGDKQGKVKVYQWTGAQGQGSPTS